MRIQVIIKGDKQVKAKVKKLGASLYLMGDAWKEIADEVMRYYSNQAFNSQGGVYGSVWARLSPKTVAVKQKLYPQFSNAPLLASQDMRNNFVAFSNQTQTIITNKSPQYKYHQSTAPRSKLPRRQMAGINKPVMTIVKRILKKGIEANIMKA